MSMGTMKSEELDDEQSAISEARLAMHSFLKHHPFLYKSRAHAEEYTRLRLYAEAISESRRVRLKLYS